MGVFGINEMLDMQRALRERYGDKWGGLSPEIGKSQLLWMIGEIGEVIDIKKHGSGVANSESDQRDHLVEELADVLMYYNDILLCYGISADELRRAYAEKFHTNMNRWQSSVSFRFVSQGETSFEA